MPPHSRPRVPRLLAITDAARLAAAGRGWLDQLLEVDAGLWLREKGLADRALLELATEVRQRFSGTLLLSARFDLARLVGAEGVHLAATGLPSTVVREAWPNGLIGRSIHGIEELAIGQPGEKHGSDPVSATTTVGCDYVTLSPVFETRSKPGVAALGPEVLSDAVDRARTTGLRVLALGGIVHSNVALAMASGAHGVAAIRGLQSPEAIERIAALLCH